MYRTALIVGLSTILSAGAAFSADEDPHGLPAHLPNPLKPTVSKTVVITEDLKELELALYGETNDAKTDDLRLSTLERTVFGFPVTRQASTSRAARLKTAVEYLTCGKEFFQEKRWQEAKDEFVKLLAFLPRDYKSQLKAETYYRLGICDYELSNIGRVSAPPKPDEKIVGSLVRSSRDNLLKAQDYYKSLGQLETAKKVAVFLDTFRDKAAKFFLY